MTEQKEVQQRLQESITARPPTPPPPPPPPPPAAPVINGVSREDLEQNTTILKQFVEESIELMASECEKCTDANKELESSVAKMNTKIEALEKQKVEITKVVVDNRIEWLEGLKKSTIKFNEYQSSC